MPELYDTSGKGEVISWAKHYPLRPELAESTYHLYQATKDEKYLKIGRKLLYDIDETCKVSCGYAAVSNVLDHSLEDRMDSFFLSETVKYLYLLFSNDSDIIVPSFTHEEDVQESIVHIDEDFLSEPDPFHVKISNICTDSNDTKCSIAPLGSQNAWIKKKLVRQRPSTLPVLASQVCVFYRYCDFHFVLTILFR